MSPGCESPRGMGRSTWKDKGDKLETPGPGLGAVLGSARWTEATTWKGVGHSGSVREPPGDTLLR